MESYITEWLSLIVRWIHVIAGIAWIGHAFLFHSFEHGLRPPEVDDVDEDVKGELWMVHGGGFFRLQKTRVLPDKYTGDLLWFKWEAAFTWLSGFLLLILVFYWSGGIYLIEPDKAPFGVGPTIAIGIGTLVLGWAIYDLVWSTLGKTPAVASAISLAMVVGASFGLGEVMSGRAAFIHVGALLGTIMTANVWMRILPNSRRMLAALEAGEEPDLSLGELGKQRSLHNGYIHFPIIFIMISSHFPTTYGHEHAWAVLLLLIVFGAGMRQVLYDGFVATPLAVKGVLGAAIIGLIAMTAPFGAGDRQNGDDGPIDPVDLVAQGTPIDPATAGAVRGVVTFDGVAPEPEKLTLMAGCEGLADGPVYDTPVIVKDGKLANAFVWIRDGWQGWQLPPTPTTEVELDQRSCVYEPRIIGARTGQPITFVNSDPIYHNVRTVIGDESLFSLSMPAKDQRITRTFKRPEVMIQARCDVHPWMRGYIGVVPHPWFAVTGDDGGFSFDGLPPGTYVVDAWHEVYGTVTETVELTASGAAELSFTFRAQP